MENKPDILYLVPINEDGTAVHKNWTPPEDFFDQDWKWSDVDAAHSISFCPREHAITSDEREYMRICSNRILATVSKQPGLCIEIKQHIIADIENIKKFL